MMGSSDVKYSSPWPSTVNFANYVTVKPCLQDVDRTNFNIWKEQMLCLLESQGLLGFIDGKILQPDENHSTTTDVPGEIMSSNHDQNELMWRRTERLVKGWILGSIGNDALCRVWGLDTAREVWLELEKIFHPEPAEISIIVSSPAEHHFVHLEDDHLPQFFEDDDGSMLSDDNLKKARDLHGAIRTRKAIRSVEKTVENMPDILMTARDHLGNTALSISAAVGNKAAAIVLVEKMRELLYISNKSGNFPIHMAALYAREEMLGYLISVTKNDMGLNPYDGMDGLRLLIYVIDAEFWDVASKLVEDYPYLATLKSSDNSSALLKISTKKSVFSRGRGFSFWKLLCRCIFINPLLRIIECHNGCTSKDTKEMDNEKDIPVRPRSTIPKSRRVEQALELVECLCKVIRSLSTKQAEDLYADAILMAAQLGIHEVVGKITEYFPLAIFCLKPGSKQSIFHVAIENRSERVYNLICQRIYDQKHFLGVDSNGNNILHSAGKLAPPHKLNEICGATLQMQREVQWYKEVENFVHLQCRETLNQAEKSPWMVFIEEHEELKEKAEKWMKDTANSGSITATLIATVMFAAAITVPGGNEGSTGFPVFLNDPAFIIFAISDAISLFTSATALLMFLAIMTSRYAEEDFVYSLPSRLIIGLGTLFISITFMVVSFSCTLYLVFGRKQDWVLVSVAALACLPVTAFGFLQYPLLVDLIYSIYGRGIFGEK